MGQGIKIDGGSSCFLSLILFILLKKYQSFLLKFG